MQCNGLDVSFLAEKMASVCRMVMDEPSWQITFAQAKYDVDCMAYTKRYPSWGTAQLAAEKLISPITSAAVKEFVYQCQVRLLFAIFASFSGHLILTNIFEGPLETQKAL